jgi:hypothetical protein
VRNLARRVLARYLEAGANLAPDIKNIEQLLSRNDMPGALDALNTFLRKKLQVYVNRHSDEPARIGTEWIQNADPDDLGRFMEVIKTLMAARQELMRPAPEAMRVENILRQLKPDLPWLEEMSRGVDDHFKHGPFTIILSKGAEHGMEEAIQTLDLVASKIRPKFPKVLYGKVYVRKGLRSDAGTYQASPHARGSQVAGSYVEATDTINLSLYATPDRSSVETLIHEFGHRYHTRFLNGDLRDRFKQLHEVGDIHVTHFALAERRKIVAEWMALFREHQQENYPDADTMLSPRASLWSASYDRALYRKDVLPLLKAFRDDKDETVAEKLEYALGQYQYGGNLTTVTNEGQYHPLYASDYGSTKWEENFAECFLKFVTGKALPAPLQDFMAQL